MFVRVFYFELEKKMRDFLNNSECPNLVLFEIGRVLILSSENDDYSLKLEGQGPVSHWKGFYF